MKYSNHGKRKEKGARVLSRQKYELFHWRSSLLKYNDPWYRHKSIAHRANILKSISLQVVVETATSRGYYTYKGKKTI
jgi:hypothetical protein